MIGFSVAAPAYFFFVSLITTVSSE